MRRFQHARYEKMGMTLFSRQEEYSLDKAQVMIALSDEKERISIGGEPPQDWESQYAVRAIDGVLQGLRRGDYELVMPTLKEKRQIVSDGIVLHRSIRELVAACLNKAAAYAFTTPYKWSSIAESIENEVLLIVKTY